MANFLEKGEKKEPQYTINDLLPTLLRIQQQLSSRMITVLAGGGVGVDLLISKYLPQLGFRKHKDLDLYIPIRQRGAVLSQFEEMGFKVDTYSYTNIAHGIADYQGLRVDLFSIDGTNQNARVLDTSIWAIEAAKQNPRTFIHYHDISIDPRPEQITFEGHCYTTLNANAQHAILKAILKADPRDYNAIEKIIGLIPSVQ